VSTDRLIQGLAVLALAGTFTAASAAVTQASAASAAVSEAAAAPASDALYVALPAGGLRTVLATDADREQRLPVAAFAMRRQPVTVAEFAAFVAGHPQWQRSQAPAAFAGRGYLQHWVDERHPAVAASPRQPVTEVSWFAAQAFCDAERPGGRLPSWNEWEYAAAADATRTDARQDPAWRATILAWYARPSSSAPADVGGPPNAYGVQDLHGLVWEWVDDFNALLVSADSRQNDDPDKLRFCGAGAISLQDRENYAVLMRIALLSSLGAADSTGNLGFRCVWPAPASTATPSSADATAGEPAAR